MKRTGWAFCFLCLSALIWLDAHSRAQGPGEGDAALKDPFAPNPVRPRAPTPRPEGTPIRAPQTDVEKAFFGKEPATPTASPFPEKSGGFIDGTTDRPRGLAALKPSERDDINKDIAVTAAQDPWMICVMSYTGPKAPEMAREFVMELRNTYRMNAFVFNYGTEERKKEYDRVKELLDRQRKFLEDSKLPLDQKVRVRYTYVPDQCAVLVGGYSSHDAALRDLERVKKLPMPDPGRVKLDIKFFAMGDQTVKEKTNELQAFELKNVKETAGGYVNPFKRAFPVRNPAIKTERKVEADPLDIAVLRKLNNSDPHSLLGCRKQFTLAIAMFRTPTGLVEDTPASGGGGVLGAIGLGRKKERDDYAAYNASTMVENLRKHMKLEAYVLHTRFQSIVCVGGYDSLEDPNMRSMRNLLMERLRIPGVDMFPEPYPMKVPR